MFRDMFAWAGGVVSPQENKEQGMPNKRILPVLVLAGAWLLAPWPASAQNTAQGALAAARSIRCTFSLIAVSSLHGDQPRAEVKPINLLLQFESINADEGTAELKSDFGQYDIIVRYARGYLHFIQSFLDGRLYATTVLEKKTSTGKLKAMHSRHEYTDVSLPGYTSSPEQYYGECEVLR
jgi:hypothetical protein